MEWFIGRNSRSYFLLGGASGILIPSGSGGRPTPARGTGGAKVDESGPKHSRCPHLV